MAENATERAKINMQGMLQSAGAAVYAKDTGSRMIFANQACLTLLGKSWTQMHGRSDVEWHLDRLQARAVLTNDQLVVESGQIHVYEEVFDTPVGSSRVILSTKSPLLDEDGKIIGIVGVSKDITERKKREEEAQSLRRELAHRLKNSVAVIHALARKTIVGADPFRRFEERLLAYGRCQDLLLRSPTGLPLRVLANMYLDTFGATDRVRIEGPHIELPPAFATCLGMALNELATNSIKYGALSFSSGSVELRWDITVAKGGPISLLLTWEERHPAISVNASHKGFGHEVLTRFVPLQLHGMAALEFRKGKLCWTLQADFRR